MSLSLVIKVFAGFLCLWLTTSAADSIPFPKEPLSTITNRDDRIGDTYVLAFINYTYRKSDGTEKEFSAEKARYGEGKILNVQGYLVHVTKDNNISDNTACSENMRGSSGNALSNRTPWIALIRRGGCTFDQKVKHVFQHGAAGAIIYNEENSNSLEKMKIIDKERNITAVFTFKWIGEEMAKIVDDGFPVWVSISEGARGLKPLTHINRTSVLFVSISFIILMVISLIWLIFYYIQRFRYLQSKDQQSRHLCSVAKRIIMKIPTKNGRFEDKENDIDCCAICIENYKQTDCIRVLPCRHEFHKNCVDPWLLEHRTCPMCKLDVLKFYGFVVGDSPMKVILSTSNNAEPLEEIIASTSNIHGVLSSRNLSGSSSNISNSSNGSNNSLNSNLVTINLSSLTDDNESNVNNFNRLGIVATSSSSVPITVSAPFLNISNTASRQFLGSEESIIQLDLDMELAENGLQSGANAAGSAAITATNTSSSENNDRIIINPTLHSIHQHGGCYIYGNRQRSASLQPLTMFNSFKGLQRSNSSTNTRYIFRPKITHSISQDTAATGSVVTNRQQLQSQRNSNFLDIGAKKRQRSKSADACYLNEAGNYLMKFALANRNPSINDSFNNINDGCNANDPRTDDSILLASESTNPVVSEPVELPTTNQCNIKIQIVDDDE